MANNQPCVSGSEAACEALSAIIARALGYPRKGSAGPGGLVQSTWNGVGNIPRGWTRRPTTTWVSSPTVAAVPIPSAMQTELAAAPAQARLTPIDRASLNAALAAIATVNLDTYAAKCIGDKAFPITVLPSFGIAWDGWGSDHTRVQTNYASTGDPPHNVWTDYPHRKPSGWPSLDLWNFPGDAAIDTQARADWRIQDLDGAISAIIYNLYPYLGAFSGDPANIPEPSYINYGLEAHRTSSYKGLVKFGVMIDPHWWSYNSMPIALPDNWGRVADYRAHLVACISDADYFRVLGRPVIGIFNYASLDAGNRTTWLAQADAINAATVTAIGVAPWWVAMDGNATTAGDMQPKGCRWKTTYGPNPLLPGYNDNLPVAGALSQYPFLTSAGWDRSRWTSSGGGISLAASITPNLDGRPRSNGNRAWVDDPLFLELVAHQDAAHGATQTGVGRAELVSVYSVSEFAEGGSIHSTDQDGSKFPDALKMGRGVTSPTTYVEKIDAHSTLCTKTGTWTYVQSLGVTYYKSDVMRSGGTGAKIGFSHYQIIKLEVALERGPDRGIANIYLDGVLQGTVDCYSATPQAPAVLWSSATLTAGMHTLEVEESGTRNASSSANGLGLDYFQSTISLVFS